MKRPRFPLTQLMLDMQAVPGDKLKQTDAAAMARFYGVREDHARFYLNEEIRMRAVG